MRRATLLAIALTACAPRTQHRTPPNTGDSLYAAGDYAAARQAYRSQLHIASANDVDRAHLLTSIALSAYWLSDYDEARRVGDSARALIGPSAPIAEAFRINNALGLVSWQQGRLAEADTLFR